MKRMEKLLLDSKKQPKDNKKCFSGQQNGEF